MSREIGLHNLELIISRHDKKTACVLTHPDVVNITAPYISSWSGFDVVGSIEEASDYALVLYSFVFTGQDLSWVEKISENQTVIIGGPALNIIREFDTGIFIPKNKKIYLFYGKLPMEKMGVLPDFGVVLASVPFTPFLTVYTGTGCHYGKCTFCTEFVIKNEGVNTSPEYAAELTILANSHNKLAGLSSSYHSYGWLLRYENELRKRGANRGCYYAYTRCGSSDWGRLEYAESIYVGVEFMSDGVLSRIKKGVTVEDILNTIPSLIGSGINVYGNIITDLWETEEEAEIHRTNLDILLNRVDDAIDWERVARLYLSQNVLKNGLTKRNRDSK